MVNMASTGVGGLGAAYVNPKQLADQNQIMKDEFARDSAMQAEEDKRQFIGQTQLQESDIIGKKLGVDTTVMGGAFGQSNYNFSQAAQIAAQRASVLPGLAGGLLGGIAGFINPLGRLFSRGAPSAQGIPQPSAGMPG
jgi:hypothetical protein